MNDDKKKNIHDFWDRASCGEELLLPSTDISGYSHQLQERYNLEPFIEKFADFNRWSGKKVLEVGVGLGADHQKFSENGALLAGIDLTERAVEHARRRLALFSLQSDLRVADAENLPFQDGEFDLVYSWGVIHHSPNTEQAAREILRVLRPGGEFRVMIYHKYSLVGFMLWLRYALAKGRVFVSLDEIYSDHLESPGTKAFTIKEAGDLFPGTDLKAWTVLTHGDLLSSGVGQRHRGWLLTFAKILWPRFIIRYLFPNNGLFLLIAGRKMA